MNYRLTTWILFGILLLMATGCSEDLDPASAPGEQQGLPVCFTAAWPQDEVGTRAVTDKTAFRDGDVIHVSAVFTLNQETTAETEQIKYATLRLSNGEWVSQTSLDMSWPWNATEATFTAYYTRAWNGPINDPGSSTDSIPPLDRLAYEQDTLDADPLEAIVENVPYGHAVHLPFRHLCTRLTLTHVGMEDEYWLTFKTPMGDKQLQNACIMTRTADNELEFDFTQVPTRINAGEGANATMVKVASHVDVVENGPRSITFNLAPGDYSTFTLTRRNGYAYITLSGIQMEGEEGKDTGFVLEAGKAYTLSLEDLSGFINWDDADSDWWEEGEPENPYAGFEVQDFMNAIAKCESYTCKVGEQNVTLLQADPYKREVKLMANVDFGHQKFDAVNLDNTITFDGGNHTIQHVDYPMFNEVNGIVTQLRLMDVNVVHQEEDPVASSQPGHDTAWGVLARICDGGRIYRVNLTRATLDIKLHTSGEDEVYNVGSLIGIVEAGVLEEISLMDNITVNVTSSRNDAMYITCVGGLVGQCSGTLQNINNMNSKTGSTGEQPDVEEGALITVTNQCKGYTTRYTGGVVGLLANGTLRHCMVRTQVDASEAIGTWNYAGGVVAAAREAEIIKPTVAGSVKGGDSWSSVATDVHTSVGGIVAHVNKASVTEGIAYNTIEKLDFKQVNTYYTIGGVIGSINQPREIERNEGRNGFKVAEYDDNKHLHYIVGTFVGSSTMTEEELREKKNTADSEEGSFIGRVQEIKPNDPTEKEGI